MPATVRDRLQDGRDQFRGEAPAVAESDSVVDDSGADLESLDPCIEDRCGFGRALNGLAEIRSQRRQFSPLRLRWPSQAEALVETVNLSR